MHMMSTKNKRHKAASSSPQAAAAVKRKAYASTPLTSKGFNTNPTAQRMATALKKAVLRLEGNSSSAAVEMGSKGRLRTVCESLGF